jgi:hypothetical protein
MRLRVRLDFLGVLGLLGAVLAAACAGTRPAPHFAWDARAGFTSIRTFAWYRDPSFRMPHGDSIADGRFLDEHIRRAIEGNLEKKGYRREPDGADVLVAYHTGQAGVEGQDEYGVYAWWWFPVYIYEGSDYEKERTLVIDVRDRGRKLIWRGAIRRLEGTDPPAVAREIDRTVADLLAKFPPAPGTTPPAKP